MSKASRDKGARRERQVVDMHTGVGIRAERVPLSGAAKFRNTQGSDVDVYCRGPHEAPFVCEVKARANGEGFATLERWLGDNDAMFLIRDRASPLVVLPFERWIELALSMQPRMREP